MPKLSVVLRNEKRKKMADKQAEQRKTLRAQSIDPKLSFEERAAAQTSLQGLARNGSMTRVVVRCSMTGRGRGVYRKFQLCRIKFRELALEGKIPGVMKASW